MDLHIESLEGGTYLASITDGERKYYVFDEQNRPKAFHCISEIKNHLSQDRFEKVFLKQDTPYDEMCGLGDEHELQEMEIDWH